MRSLKDNNQGSAVPLILFVLTIFSLGALYTLFFIEVAFPIVSPLIPDSTAKTFITMMMYGIPIMILLVGGVAMLKEALIRRVY